MLGALRWHRTRLPRLFYHLAVLQVLALKTVMKTMRHRRLRTRAHNVLFYLLFGYCEWREDYYAHRCPHLFAAARTIDSRQQHELQQHGRSTAGNSINRPCRHDKSSQSFRLLFTIKPSSEVFLFRCVVTPFIMF